MTVDERLEKLERELAGAKRRNQWTSAVAGLAVTGLLLAWVVTGTTPAVAAEGAGEVPKEIRANAFIVEDENGTVRARLSERRLDLLDEKGLERASLGVSFLSLNDEKGELRAGLGTRGLGLRGERGELRVSLGSELGLSLWDERGELRAGLGTCGLDLLDEKGVSRASLIASKDGASLSVRDETGRDRAVIGSTETERVRDGATIHSPESSIHLFDKDGKVLWRAP
jgi:hypothetical protein